jgi:tetratricopeptide (TPR) repeat protein
MPPLSVEVLCNEARMAIAQRDWEKARQSYLQALGIKSDVPDIHQGLATVCFQLHDLSSAAHHFKEVTRLDPHRAGAFINLGAVYNLLDQVDEALGALRRGVQIDPHRAEGYYNLGLVYKRKGQVDLAIHSYREALRLNPRMADANYNLGNLYLEKEEYRLAIQHYRQALAIRQNWEKALQGLQAAEMGLDEKTAEEKPAEEVKVAAQLAATQAAIAQALKINPNRTLDPDSHGVLLTSLHRATIESESQGVHFLKLVEEEVEPAIKELSNCLINPDSSITQLDACIQRFEDAVAHMKAARENLVHSVSKVRTLGDRLVAQAN